MKTDHGAVPAYLAIDSGGPGFPAGQRIYYDVTSSALHRSLAGWLGERAAAIADQAFLRRLQLPEGGWPWGVFKDGLTPLDPRLAPIVGLWATADLSIDVGATP